jgi:hypothetical protein
MSRPITAARSAQINRVAAPSSSGAALWGELRTSVGHGDGHCELETTGLCGVPKHAGQDRTAAGGWAVLVTVP